MSLTSLLIQVRDDRYATNCTMSEIVTLRLHKSETAAMVKPRLQLGISMSLFVERSRVSHSWICENRACGAGSTG